MKSGHTNRRASMNLPTNCPEKHFYLKWCFPFSYTCHLKKTRVMQNCNILITEVNPSHRVTWGDLTLLKRGCLAAKRVVDLRCGERHRCVAQNRYREWYELIRSSSIAREILFCTSRHLLTKRFSCFMLMLVKFSLYYNNTLLCE